MKNESTTIVETPTRKLVGLAAAIFVFVFAVWLYSDVLPANAACYCVALKTTVGIKSGLKIGGLTDGCEETTCLGTSSCGTVCNMTAVSAGACEFVTGVVRTCAAINSALGCCVCNDGSTDTAIGSDKSCGLACQSKKGKKSWNDGACKAASGATGPPPKKYYTLYNALGTTSIPDVMGKVIAMFLGVVGAIALAVFVYGGIMWMTARGSEKQAQSARSAIINGVIGLAIIAFAYTLSSSLITMLTTMPVPEPKELPSEQATQAETEQAQVQTSVQEQKAQEEAAKQQGAQEAATACAPGRTCVPETCKDKTIYSQCWAAGCTGINVCCPTTLTCPNP